MNAFVKKEIRLLLPNFAFACILALPGAFFPNDSNNVLNVICYFLACVFCPAAAVMLALSSFGTEIGSGTFSNLLAQPISRQKIWETKTLLLGLALAGATFVWAIAFLISALYFGHNQGFRDWLDLLSIVIVTGLVIFSGGLWTVLLLRQVAAAFWFTLLVPGALMVMLAACFTEHDGNFFQGMVVSVLGLYSLAGFFFARWLFFRAQDLQWSGGIIEIPELRGLARLKSTKGTLRQWRPHAALWRKEFMLHQSQLVIAFVLGVLHVGVLVARQFVDPRKSSELDFMLKIFWGLWLVMPVLIGCAAVSEERKIGTHEGQLCLPVKRRTQFGIKYVTAMALSLALGLGVPLLFEGTRILPPAHLNLGAQVYDWISLGTPAVQWFGFELELLNFMLPMLTLVLIVVGFCGVALLVSSLSRNTLQSLAPTTLALVAIWGLIFLAVLPWGRLHHMQYVLWSGPLPFFVGGPFLVLTVLMLTARNFYHAQPTLKLAARNLTALAVVILFSAIATSAVYHRLWEKLTPFEPPHGPAQLARTGSISLGANWDIISARLPDGRLRLAELRNDSSHLKPWDVLLGNLKFSMDPDRSVSGSNWLTIQRISREFIGIKSDGTLWASESPVQATKLSDGTWHINDKGMWNLVRVGDGTNWSSLCRCDTGALLVKKDGTLWRWGTEEQQTRKGRPGIRAFTPEQIGTNSDWAEVFMSRYRPGLCKTDGSTWLADDWETNNLQSLEILPGFRVYRIPTLRAGEFPSMASIYTYSSHALRVGVDQDGSFRVWARQELTWDKKHSFGNYKWVPFDMAIGKEDNWLAVAGAGNKIITLKQDGTLWLWTFKEDRFGTDEFQLAKTINITPTRLGTHSDWIAIATCWQDVIALAADGSLWFWPLSGVDQYFDSEKQPLLPLLDISRKPQLLGNIIGKTE